MHQPLPPDNDSAREDLPLRHHRLRTREAEIIRLEFIRSRKNPGYAQDPNSANPLASDEQ